MMEKEYLWGFYYNPMVEESSYGLASLHRTKKGAEIAMKFHKAEEKVKFDEIYLDVIKRNKEKIFKDILDFIPKFGERERWIVDKIEIQD